MNGSVWAYPIVESIHMIGIVLLAGMAVIFDLRLLGLRLAHKPVSELAAELGPWTSAGLAIVLITGPLLVSTDPDRYYDGRSFRFKMACLFLVLLFDFAVLRKVRPGLQRLAGSVSLVLWGCVVAGGRLIGVGQ